MQLSLTVRLFPSPVLKFSFLFLFVPNNMLKFSTFTTVAQVTNECWHNISIMTSKNRNNWLSSPQKNIMLHWTTKVTGVTLTKIQTALLERKRFTMIFELNFILTRSPTQRIPYIKHFSFIKMNVKALVLLFINMNDPIAGSPTITLLRLFLPPIHSIHNDFR